MPCDVLPAINDLHAVGARCARTFSKVQFAKECDAKTIADAPRTEQHGPWGRGVAVPGQPAASETMEDVDDDENIDQGSESSNGSVGHPGFIFENFEAIMEEIDTKSKLPMVNAKRRQSKHQQLLDMRQKSIDILQHHNNELEQEIGSQNGKNFDDDYFSFMKRNLKSPSLTAYSENAPGRRS